MVTFRCKRSGNTIKIDMPEDIENMRKHEGYEEVKDEELPSEKVEETAEKRQVLKLKK